MPEQLRYIPLSALPPAQSLADATALRDRFSSALTTTLDAVNAHTAEYPRSTIYTGLAGISYLNYHLSRSPVLPPTSRTALRTLAQKQLRAALKADPLSPPRSGAKVALLDTSIGPAALVLLYQLHYYADIASASTPFANSTSAGAGTGTRSPFSKTSCARCAELLKSAFQLALAAEPDADPEDGCELLYGRAGLLHALLLLRNAAQDIDPTADGGLRALLDPVISDAALGGLVNNIVARGVQGAERFRLDVSRGKGKGREDECMPALMWSWHGKRYLGGAHGVAGILLVLLHAPPALFEAHAGKIRETLRYIVSLQDAEGNWPTKAMAGSSRTGGNELVQWCHGAPGTIPLLARTLYLSRADPSPLSLDAPLTDTLTTALARAADVTYARGMLRKGPGLCHGVAGCASALFAAADVDDERRLVQGCHLLVGYLELSARAGGRAFARPDYPWSLYEGLGGLCAVLGEAVERLGEGQSGSGRWGVLGGGGLV
ncbi:hypothetical protein DENSPDRAFT_933984 [Dentipellis sp. KUC8613]|nr:hypothetical protein DENSPDRAFT_933984 [Dentipellis sp. KUC8613]